MPVLPVGIPARPLLVIPARPLLVIPARPARVIPAPHRSLFPRPTARHSRAGGNRFTTAELVIQFRKKNREAKALDPRLRGDDEEVAGMTRDKVIPAPVAIHQGSGASCRTCKTRLDPGSALRAARDDTRDGCAPSEMMRLHAVRQADLAASRMIHRAIQRPGMDPCLSSIGTYALPCAMHKA